MKVSRDMKTPVIVVGMARSGTTVVSHLLGCSPEVYCEIEPHILWKTGSFQSLGDDEFSEKTNDLNWIRQKLFSDVGDKLLVEKSPPNCLRPKLVYSVFPDAKIVYIERDPVRCIDSNLKRSLMNDSLKPSIIIKKYFISSGSPGLAGARGKRKLYQQLKINDVPSFVVYFLRMLYIRGVKKSLPFGPKLSGYCAYVKNNGLLSYHVKVYLEAQKRKVEYQSLYGDKFMEFKLESFQKDMGEVKRLYEFCNLPVDDNVIDFAMRSISEKRVLASVEEGEKDAEILQMMHELENK